MIDQTANDRLCQYVGAVPVAVPIRMRLTAIGSVPTTTDHFGETVRVTKPCNDLESLGLNTFRADLRKMRDSLDGVVRELRGCRVRECQQQELGVLVPAPASRLQMTVEYRLRRRFCDSP